MSGLRPLERLAVGAIVVAVAVAAGFHYASAPDLAAFAAATASLAGLAWLVSFATEQVGERFGPAVTGVLQSTLGNLPEFFIVVFALSAGEVVVAKFSIIGSLFANALLVLGFVIVVGAHRSEDQVMRFHPRLPNDTATLLLLTVFIIVVVGASGASNDNASRHIVAISSIAAVGVLAVYVAWLIPYLRMDRPPEEARRGAARVPFAPAVGLLAAAGVGAAFASDWFVAELTPTIDDLGISRAFAGLVIAAIAGNAVENAAGIVLAYKRQSDLAISVVKNSVAQIAAFLFPALVLISLFFTDRLTFEVDPVYAAALALTALVVWQTTGDGAAPAFEGWALIAVYVALATLTLYE